MKLRTLLLFVVLANSVYAQISVQGQVRDAVTKEAVSFASISIVGTTSGTAADDKGKFSMNVPSLSQTTTLSISAIGYQSKKVDTESSGELVIDLDPAVTQLEGVEIITQRITPQEVVREALKAITTNYPQKPFNMEFLSTINVENPITQARYSVETIAIGYYTGYASSATKKFDLVHQRRIGNDPLRAIDYPYWPTFEIHRADLLADPAQTGIFNPKFIDRFDLVYEGVTVFDDDTVFQISYSAPKPTTQLTGYGIKPRYYRGQIYIATSTYAVVKHVVETDAFLYTIIYRKLGNLYYPYYISGDRRTKATQPNRITNSVSLRSVTLENVRIIKQSNEFQQAEVPEDLAFWNLNYPVRE